MLSKLKLTVPLILFGANPEIQLQGNVDCIALYVTTVAVAFEVLRMGTRIIESKARMSFAKG